MREIAHSERSGENFSLIRILFMKRNELNETSINEVDAADILYFSQALLDVTRKQDCVARMGINECVILIRDNKCNVQNVLSRLQSSSDLTVEKTLSISIASTQFEHGENSLELLHRLDSSALSTH